MGISYDALLESSQRSTQMNHSSFGLDSVFKEYEGEQLISAYKKPVHCGDTHQITKFNFSKSFNVNRSSIQRLHDREACQSSINI